jgi:hypothetical protein
MIPVTKTKVWNSKRGMYMVKDKMKVKIEFCYNFKVIFDYEDLYSECVSKEQ